jgi:hypothetical protein
MARYPVDYVRHAAREIRKLEGRIRLGEPGPTREEQLELMKTIAKAFDEIAAAVEGLERSRE